MIPPLRREVLVTASPEHAFALFTERIGDWWPLARFGVFGDGTVAFEERLIVERSGDRESVWGEVTSWEPPGALGFTWHPGYGSGHATDVRVTFEAAGEQTLVTLVHSGWERMTDPQAARREYGNGWPAVLAGFAALAMSS
ncbi:SRPBCC domain-containing protein [Pseudolysinimonas yzui]|uniref:SRPBCC domain-containing protein n=1 Tax=Pseudolysinimonas yzui TaxID=2708254 RepID=UPI001E581826|nr:SRPBCC domain-containing protein [Pseudolysinimonas yzui]